MRWRALSLHRDAPCRVDSRWRAATVLARCRRPGPTPRSRCSSHHLGGRATVRHTQVAGSETALGRGAACWTLAGSAWQSWCGSWRKGPRYDARRRWVFLSLVKFDRGALHERDGERVRSSLARTSFPAFHSRSTCTPPRARRPVTRLVGQALGSAGSRCTVYSSPSRTRWPCSSNSAIAAVPPKLPSIWSGGCAQNRLGRAPAAARARGRAQVQGLVGRRLAGQPRGEQQDRQQAHGAHHAIWWRLLASRLVLAGLGI